MTTINELSDANGAVRAEALEGIETQHSMAVNDEFLGNLATPDDRDWVRVALQPDTTYVLQMQGYGADPVNDPLLELYDATGARVAFNDDLCQGGALDAQIIFTTPSLAELNTDTTLSYYLNARSYSQNPALRSDGDYRLSVTEQRPLRAPDTPPTAPTALLDPVVTVTGVNGIHTGGMVDDILQGGLGPDRFDGGGQPADGIGDSVSYHQAAQAVRVNLTTGAGDLGEADGDTLIRIENLVGSRHDDTLTGDAGANILLGGAGDDLLDGGPGADLLIGGAGRDTVSYERAYSTHGVRVDLALGVADGSAAQGDRLVGIENLIGSWEDDELYGDAADNRLHGEVGDDRLAGRGGADVFVSYQDGGHDTALDFDPEQDRLELHLYGTDLDWRSLSITADGTDTVIEMSKRGSLILQNVSPDELGAQHFVLVRDTRPGASSAADGDGSPSKQSKAPLALVSEPGGGTLKGGWGNDTLIGGPGTDILDGGNGADTASYETSTAAVMIDLSQNNGYVIGKGGYAEGDKLMSIENLTGSKYDDTLIGDDDDNVLKGLGGNDTLMGKGGADLLEGGADADTLDGGTGADTASYETSTAAVTVDLSGTQDKNGYVTGQGGHAQGDKLKNIERLTGSGYNDTLTGDNSDNVLRGLAGNDTLTGKGGADTLEGGAGADTLTGGAGNDQLDGGAGADTLTGGAGNDQLDGDAGADTLTGDVGNDQLEGGADADTLDGGTGADTASYETSTAAVTVDLSGTQDKNGYVTGQGGHAQGDKLKNIEYLTGSAHGDTLTGDNSDNVLTGLGGDDTLTGGAGNDQLDGGAGADTLKGGAGNDRLEGGVGVYTDILEGGAGADTLMGGHGNDRLEGGAGADTLDGGAFRDTASYASSTAAVTVDLSGPKSSGYVTGKGGHAQGDKLKSIEYLTGSGYNDTLTGDNSDNVLRGLAGNDTLKGGAGVDLLEGGAGADTLDGGTSNYDKASYASSTAAVTIDLGGTQDKNGYVTGQGGHAQGDKLKNIELLAGSRHGDTLTGDGRNNDLEGGAGADTLDGGAGTEDAASYRSSTAAVTVDLSGTQDKSGYVTGKGGHAQGDKLKNIEQLNGSEYDDTLIGDDNHNRLAGGSGDDTLTGKGGRDLIYAGYGNDRLDGGPGIDYLIGGPGNDVLEGGAGRDILTGGAGADTLDGGTGARDEANYRYSGAAVTVDLSGSKTGGYVTGKGGYAEGDKLKNIEEIFGSDYNDTLTGDNNDNILSGHEGDDTLAGKGGDDTLKGSSGRDTLKGGAGADTLDGGAGADILEGGAGNDTFLFNNSEGIDIIKDFAAGDRIDLRFFSLTGGISDLTIAQGSKDTEVTAGTLTITLENFTGSLDANDFIF